MSKIGWGVIGSGGIADRRTIPEGILPAKNANLVAVMDANPEAAAQTGEKYGVPAYTSVEDLLADESVQAVYIATPTHCHKLQAEAAAKAGKHVLLEKPMSRNLQEAEDIAKACEDAGVKLGVGFMMRFNAFHEKIKEMIDKGLLGTVVFARAQLTCWYPAMEGAWRQDPELGGGGALMDLSVHCIDLLEMLLGPISEVSAYLENRVQTYPADDTNAIMAKFANGTIGFIDCAFNIPDDASENVLELQGSKGCIKGKMTISQGPGGEVVACLLENVGGYSAAQERSAATYKPVTAQERNTYKAEIEAFSDAILNDTQPPVNGALGVHNMKVAEAVKKASETGKNQKVD